MKRLLAITLCALGIAYAITACGGGGDDGAVSEDKLTIVGSGN
jgi:hypothetical protein